MTAKTTYIDVPEVVGVFDMFEAMQKAIYDLMIAGFSRYDISLLGDREAIKEKLGISYWQAKDLEDDPNAPRTHFVSEEAIGELQGALGGGFFFLGSYIAMAALLTPASTLAASIAVGLIGGAPTAVLGTILARRVGKHHRDYYADQISNGGILIWVRAAMPERQELAMKIMKGHSGKDVHMHEWSE